MNKSMKASNTARPKELTAEEKAAQVARFLSQKRESFAQMFFAGLANNPCIADKTPKDVAKFAISAADALMEELYPIPDDSEKNE